MRLNQFESSWQRIPDVTVLSNGNIFVAWQTYASVADGGDGSNYGIAGGIFDASGAALSGDLLLNESATGAQTDVAVAPDGAGGFVAVWESPSGSSSGQGIVLRTFDSTGAPTSGDIVVDSQNGGTDPAIARLNDGSYVVTWAGREGSTDIIYQRHFTAAGVATGDSQRVNAQGTTFADNPDIVATDDGGWIVAWNANPSSGGDIFAQRFDAAGVALGGNFQIDSGASSSSDPVVAALSGGRFALAFTDYYGVLGDEASYGIAMQMIGTPAAGDPSGDPALSALPDVTLGEAAVNAGYAPVFAATPVALADRDSADLNGGRLMIHRIEGPDVEARFPAPDGLTQDRLTFQHSRIEIQGTDLRVDNVSVGTLVGDGQDGTGLEVVFNGAATPEIAKLLLNALHYANGSDDPSEARRFEVTLTDGDGGQSAHDSFTLNVTPQRDGLAPAGPAWQVNTHTPSDQDDSDVAALAGGGHVTVWTSRGQDDGNTDGVFAQLHDATGAPVGPEFQVSTTIVGSQVTPKALGLSDGSFIIAWQGNGIGDGSGVFLQHFDATGQPTGGETLINENIVSGHYDVDLAAHPGGGFTAVWRNNWSELYHRHFDNLGQATSGEIAIVTPGSASLPGIVAQSGGGTAVIWHDSVDADILIQRLAADGSPNGSAINVTGNGSIGSETAPVLATLSDGAMVAAWQSTWPGDGSSGGIYARILEADGTPRGDAFLVNEVVQSNQYGPVLTALPGGGFVVGFVDGNGLDGSGPGVFAQQYDNAGRRIDGQIQLNEIADLGQDQPALAALAGGGFVVSYSSYGSGGDGDGRAVLNRIFGDSATYGRDGAPILQGVNAEVTMDEDAVNLIPQLLDANGAVALSDPDGSGWDGGLIRVGAASIVPGFRDQFAAPDDATQDQLGLRQAGGITLDGARVLIGGVQMGTVTGDGRNGQPFEIQLGPNAGLAEVELLIEQLTFANLSDDPESGRLLRIEVVDGDGRPASAALVEVTVTPQTDGAVPILGERQANTTTANAQDDSHVATLADGGFVMVWAGRSQTGDTLDGVYGQRFDANGNPVGPEFHVNQTVANNQNEARVAALDDGGYVVVWTDSSGADGSSGGIFMRRYGADGLAQAGEEQVNQYSSSWQHEPDVTLLANGDYVVSWTSWNNTAAGGSDYDVFARVYGSDGTARTGEFLVNTQNAATQDMSKVAALAGGGFVVVYESDNSGSAGDGSSAGIFQQRFGDATAGYAAQGTETQVNGWTDGNQDKPAIAGLADGGWVVAWESDQQDGDGDGIFAQRFAADGSRSGPEFRVNEDRESTQSTPEITALSHGGFAIAYSSYGYDGSATDVHVQQYDAAGHRLDGLSQANVEESGTQNQAVIAALADGGFVTGWTSQNSGSAGDGDSIGVFFRLFGNTPPTVGDVTVVTAEDTPVVLEAALFSDAFTDADGQSLAEIRIDTVPAVGRLELDGTPLSGGETIQIAMLLAGRLGYRPDPDVNGSDSFVWSGSDGISYAAVAALSNITITPVDDPEGLPAIPDATVDEGGYMTRSFTLGDPDADTWQVTVDYGDGGAPVSWNTSTPGITLGNYYTADGIYTVNVTVDDGAGSPESGSFQVTVLNAPPIARNESFTTDEDTALVGRNLLANDSDPGSDPLQVTQINGLAYTPGDVVTLSSGATVQISAAGLMRYDPTVSPGLQALTVGTHQWDSFTYTIADDAGLTDIATVSVRVDGANDNADPRDDLFVIGEDATLSGSVLADNGSGPDSDPEGDALTVVAVNGLAGNVGAPVATGWGAVQIDANGQIAFTPSARADGLALGQHHDLNLTYTVSEAGAGQTASAAATIRIMGANDDPTAQDDSASTAFNSSVDIAVLANDYDVDDGDVVSVSTVGTPGNGTASLNLDGSIR